MTLLELLVALVVFGLLIGGIAALTHFTFGFSSRRTRVSEAAAESTPAVDYLRAMLGDARPVAASKGGPVVFVGSSDRVALVAPLGGGFTNAGGLQAIAAGVRDGALRIAWTPLGDQDLPVPPTAGATVLLPDVAAVRFRYFGGQPSAWHDSWAHMPVLPLLISINVTRSNGTRPGEVIAALRVTGVASSNQR
jgi:hypothetical protein